MMPLTSSVLIMQNHGSRLQFKLHISDNTESYQFHLTTSSTFLAEKAARQALFFCAAIDLAGYLLRTRAEMLKLSSSRTTI